MGKGNRVRTIMVPEWASFLVSSWKAAARIDSGYVVRSFTSTGTLNGRLSVSAIWDIVLKYSTAIGVPLAPHDLRRTYAKLARTNGAPIEVIQHSLGHSSVVTTERYMATGEESNAGDFFSLA
jgi:integrase/recombinase XerD